MYVERRSGIVVRVVELVGDSHVIVRWERAEGIIHTIMPIYHLKLNFAEM